MERGRPIFETARNSGNGKFGRGGLEAKKAGRLQFMLVLYDAVDGFDAQFVELTRIATSLGLRTSDPLEKVEVLKRVRYLQGEGLISVSGPPADPGSIAITHQGVREVEQARSNPERPTEHFPAIDSLELDPVSPARPSPADPSSSESLGSLSEQDRLEVVRITQSLRTWADQLGLEEQQRAELEADVKTIEAQLESPVPKVRLIECSMESIKGTVSKAPRALGTPSAIVSAGILSTIKSYEEKQHGDMAPLEAPG